MIYRQPAITDFGSIASHTYNNPGAGDKMNTPVEPWHYDKWCEFSGGTDADDPECLIS